jgi:hypothetical protein
MPTQLNVESAAQGERRDGNYSMGGRYSLDPVTGNLELQNRQAASYQAELIAARAEATRNFLADIENRTNPYGTLATGKEARDMYAMQAVAENAEGFENREKAIHAMEMTMDAREEADRMAEVMGLKHPDGPGSPFSASALMAVMGLDACMRWFRRDK